MKVKAYFDDIHQVILKYIQSAREEIKVAVAWFTDSELFDALCKKAQQGVSIQVILINDQINCGPRKLNFFRLENFNGQVNFVENENFNKMHHKFCVIDQCIVITGSYNWTNQARNNAENITIIEDNINIVKDFLNIFSKLVESNTTNVEIKVSPDVVKRRLEMIKNLILLDETDNILTQLTKLEPVIQSYSLQSIQQSLKYGQYQQAVEQIILYLKSFTALVISEDYEIFELKFNLKILELRLESITNEQADLERDLILFNRRQYEILGDVTREILKIKADYFKLKTERVIQRNNENYESILEESEQAQKIHDDYSEEYEAVQQKQVKKLDEFDEKELKNIFRKACNRCHPDKVPESQKEEASRVFIELKEAYDNNDIESVKVIYAQLQQGNFSQTKSTVLKKIDLLRSAITEIKYKIEQNLTALHRLRSDPTIISIQKIGTHEEQWISFLQSKRIRFEEELIYWKTQLDKLINQGNNPI